MDTQYSYCSRDKDTDEIYTLRFYGAPYTDFETCLAHAKSYLQMNEGVKEVMIVKDVALVTPNRPIPDDRFSVEMAE